MFVSLLVFLPVGGFVWLLVVVGCCVVLSIVSVVIKGVSLVVVGIRRGNMGVFGSLLVALPVGGLVCLVVSGYWLLSE